VRSATIDEPVEISRYGNPWTGAAMKVLCVHPSGLMYTEVYLSGESGG